MLYSGGREIGGRFGSVVRVPAAKNNANRFLF